MYNFRLRAKTVKNNFPQLKGAVRGGVVKIVNESATEIAAIARQLAPVDTGFLRDSIAVESYNRNELLRVIVDAPYAGFVEYGTSAQAAQPFLRPAVEAVKSRMNRRLGQIVRGLGGEIGAKNSVARY